MFFQLITAQIQRVQSPNLGSPVYILMLSFPQTTYIVWWKRLSASMTCKAALAKDINSC